MYLYYGDQRALVFGGDCAEVMPHLPAESIHALVTDPPAGITFMGMDWDRDKGGRDKWVTWLTGVMREAYRLLKPGAHGLVWALPRTSHWTATALEDAGFEIRDCITHLFGSGFPKGQNIGKAFDRAAGAITNSRAAYDAPPVTPEAVRWHGWNTTLKPAAEHWWLVRKPFTGTVIANLAEHGVGALNIDACRIGGGVPRPTNRPVDGPDRNAIYGRGLGGSEPTTTTKGRWPTNALFTHSPGCDPEGACVDGCPVAELDAQSGWSRSPGSTTRGAGGRRAGRYGPTGAQGRVTAPGDDGGASRFFPVFRYTPKAPPSERPRAGSVFHPTVKPLALMEWLIRLITPEGGTVLDPFGGSGATLEAALRAPGGYQAVVIEAEPAYLPLIRQRVERATAAQTTPDAPALFDLANNPEANNPGAA